MIDTKNIPSKYRPVPFWSWNEKLDAQETKEQVKKMKSVGMGGFFMHARSGLQTEYMEEEWFANVDAAIGEAEACGMHPWAYDENGWPSGFGAGLVNGLGLEYQQKYLRMERVPEHTKTQICQCGEHYFYYEVNPFYVDTLDKKVIAKFIDTIYQPYYERYGNRIEGFFTDEPQISRDGISWSFVFEKEYQKRYHENLLTHLEELFIEKDDYKTTRVRFWKMVTELFSESYVKQIYDWCEAHQLKLTGHLLGEGTPYSQLTTNGACMPHYEYFHIPGMDWLGRKIVNGLTIYQLTSVAEQLGKDAVLSEDFALCGHNVSMAELKGIYEWQMVRGVNMLCQHLEGYSIRGMRKRDYPPTMYYQQPWWSEYDKWIEAVSRVGMILREGKKQAEVLFLHPQTTAWTMYNASSNTKDYKELFLRLCAGITELEEKHILFHFGDEIIMERHARVENGRLVIGNQSYVYVIDEFCEVLLPHTEKLLSEFKAQGGKIVSIKELKEFPITDVAGLTYTKRFFDGCQVHYFVNSSPEVREARIYVEGRMLDIYSGEFDEFTGVHRFEPWGSLMIFEDGTPNAVCTAKTENYIYPEGEFQVADGVLNTLTLDKCDYYFDGILQEKNGYVLNICERANKLERKVHIKQEYRVQMKHAPKELYLVTETPENFKISINGVEIAQKVVGYFRDKSFKKIEITKYVATGENLIVFECDFVQSPQVYENLKKAWIFESEKNKLTYDMEIEPIYLLGDFSVETTGEWTELGKDAVRYAGSFVLDAPIRTISLKDIEKQGFPFFCGELTVEGELDIQGERPVLVLEMKGVNAVCIEINDFKKTILSEDRVSLEKAGRGKQKIKMKLINNLRNLLGPHHLELGEHYSVGPESFYKEVCVWNPQNMENGWNEEYCFVKFGL